MEESRDSSARKAEETQNHLTKNERIDLHNLSNAVENIARTSQEIQALGAMDDETRRSRKPQDCFGEFLMRSAQARKNGWSLPSIQACIDCMQTVLTGCRDDRVANLDIRVAALLNLSSVQGVHYSHTRDLSSLERSMAIDLEALSALTPQKSPHPSRQFREARRHLLSHLLIAQCLWRERTGEFPDPPPKELLDPQVDDQADGHNKQPQRARWLYAQAAFVMKGHDDEARDLATVEDLEAAISKVYEALLFTTVYDPEWEDLVNSARL